MRIKLLSTALVDLSDGRLFYERQGEGLGEYFFDSLFSDIDSLMLYGGIHPNVFGYHRMLSKRFPYAIYYRLEGEAEEGSMLGTLTKMDIVLAVQTENGYTLKKSIDIVNTLLEILKSTLASGEDALISGFGKFQIRDKRERRGRNPATDSGMILPARRVVTFKCSGKLRDKVNGGK